MTASWSPRVAHNSSMRVDRSTAVMCGVRGAGTRRSGAPQRPVPAPRSTTLTSAPNARLSAFESTPALQVPPIPDFSTSVSSNEAANWSNKPPTYASSRRAVLSVSSSKTHFASCAQPALRWGPAAQLLRASTALLDLPCVRRGRNHTRARPPRRRFLTKVLEDALRALDVVVRCAAKADRSSAGFLAAPVAAAASS